MPPPATSRRTLDTQWWTTTASPSLLDTLLLPLLSPVPLQRRTAATFTKKASGASPVDVLIGCYNKRKLLDTLNMTNFKFTTSLNFSALNDYDAAKLFNFTSFTRIRKEMKTRTAAPPDFITLAYATNEQCRTGPSGTSGAELVLTSTNTGMDGIHTNMVNMEVATGQLFASLTSIELELQPLITLMNAFVDEGGDCSFINEHYHKLEKRLCSQALPALLYVGLLTFLNGVFGIFMVTNGLIINKRYGGHGENFLLCGGQFCVVWCIGENMLC